MPVTPASAREIPFLSPYAAGTAFGVTSLAAADFDSDGDGDLIGAEASGQVQSWINGGGQFALGGTSVAPAGITEGVERALMTIELRHLGRIGEAPLRLTRLALRFEQSPGVRLADGEIAGLVEALRLYLDDGSLAFDSGLDVEVASFPAPSTTGGLAVLSLPGAEAALELSAGAGPSTFFLTLELTPDASTAGIGSLRITHSALSGSAAENLDYGTPLLLEHTPEVTAEIAVRALGLFYDDFESGDSSAWSVVVP